ncbi:MAG TPA: hypothetical protein VMX74_11560 [Pirellulales bacterium]|nr:hypothetical protein [Pirellulales bacterium]
MSHRIHNDLYQGPKKLDDPGDTKTILVSEDLSICEMVSVAAETRTLADPTKPGIRFTLRLLTDGGDIIVHATEGFNVALETDATFADAGDTLELISVTKTWRSPQSASTFRWQVFDENIGVTIA